MSLSPQRDNLHILMAASEAVPYAKTGGLADVVGALPAELLKLGHQVTLVMPHYSHFLAGRPPLQPVARLVIPSAQGAREVGLEEEIVPVPGADHPLRVLMVRYDPYFDRTGLYQSPDGDYPDNLDRFVLFSKAVLEAIRFLYRTRGERIDVLHLHDWQTALCAVYLKTVVREEPALAQVKTLLTLHNVGYQGIFPAGEFPKTDLPPALFSPGGLEFYKSINLLKGGIIYADAVSTVSSTYAQEIMTPECGFGLEGVLADRTGGVQGITNGIDVTVWDPARDPHLSANYSSTDMSGKQACKRALQRALGLPISEVPLLAVIGRLTPQKGFDLLAAIVPELMALDLQLAILGTGDRSLEQEFSAAKAKYPDGIGLHMGFNEGLAHQVEAGADMLLMPSRYEPCGLTQLYSLRYGTVPIVRKTGGLADTVIPFKPSAVQARQATGFHFVAPSPDALLYAVLLALQIYKDRGTWDGLLKAGMDTDVSWRHAALQYVELYRSLIGTAKQSASGL
jgi:starch synthase